MYPWAMPMQIARLWESEPEAMEVALQRHDRLLAEVIEGHGGAVVTSRGEGDSFFAVFHTAVSAVEAAGQPCSTSSAARCRPTRAADSPPSPAADTSFPGRSPAWLRQRSSGWCPPHASPRQTGLGPPQPRAVAQSSSRRSGARSGFITATWQDALPKQFDR
jgi:hypothetical protein